MNEPAQPFTYFNCYDILLFVVLFLAFTFLTNKRLQPIDRIIVRSIKLILVIFIIPFVSWAIEIELAVNKYGVDDSFTLLYTYLKIPIWWTLGFYLILYGSQILYSKQNAQSLIERFCVFIISNHVFLIMVQF